MSSTNTVWIEAVAIAAPGILDWSQAQTILQHPEHYTASDLPLYQPALLPANERRRASPSVRMAFRVAEAATQQTDIPAAQLTLVFTSGDGDLAIAQRLCKALAEPSRLISPTDFHNSVHNAAAGYWSIASHAQGASTALAAAEHSFAVGLLEAIGLVCIEHSHCLLVAYDLPAEQPLLSKRPLDMAMGTALLLTPTRTARSLASVQWQLGDSLPATTLPTPLEALRVGNPAGRALPILHLLAQRQNGQVTLELPNNRSLHLSIDLQMLIESIST